MKNSSSLFKADIILTVAMLSCAFHSFGINDALKIRIARGSYSDEIAIRFMQGATSGFDGCCDAWKLFSANTAVPNLFTKTDIGEELAINAMPEFISSSSVEVFVRIGTAATYSVTAEELGAFAPDVCIRMQDVVTGQIYNLRTAETYLIALPVSSITAPARFIVFFSAPALVQTTDVSCQGCADGSATITKAGETNWQYSVVNSSGEIVSNATSSSETVTINGLTAGNYTLTVSSAFSCSETKTFTINGPLTYYSLGNGNWENASSWSAAGCGGAAGTSAPSSRDNIVICAGTNITVNADASFHDLAINGNLFAMASFSLTGDWVNSGSFTANTYTVAFSGNVLQTISGSTTFNHLLINNAAPANAVWLNAPVTVNGVFALKDGHLVTSSANTLTCGTNASIQLLGTPQDSSFVKGSMKHTVNVSSGVTKIFPVGKDNSYRRIDLTVDQKTTAVTTYTAEMFNSSAAALNYALPPSISNVSKVRYHEITQSPSNTKLDMAQAVMYFGCSGGSDFVNDLNMLSVAKDNGSGAWVDLGDNSSGSSCGGANYLGTTLSGTFTSFTKTKFTLTGTGAPPPEVYSVTLLNFDATKKENSVQLNWTTASEFNSDYFAVERGTRDKGQGTSEIQWQAIGTVKAAGASSSAKNYEFTDSPSEGRGWGEAVYYRLKSVDKDGSFQYSKIVSVNFENENFVLVYPNPASDFLRINLSERKDSEVNIVFYNTLGDQFLSETLITTTDNETISLNIQNKLKPGVYILGISCNNKVKIGKVVLQ